MSKQGRVGTGARALAVVVGLAFVTAVTTAAVPAAQAQSQSHSRGAMGLSDPIQRIDIVDGGLVATTVTGQQLPLDLTAQQVPGATCPILNVHLGPINLDLLGLAVDTSQICLAITAVPGPGNLVGNILCLVARLLDRGVSLSDILASLTAAQQNALLNALLDILNGALNALNNAVVTSAQTGASCTILDLALGPIDLNLLGLNVHLDNCANGPVTVTVTAEPGIGNLLGNLICGLLGNIPIGTTLGQILQQVLTAILGALG